MLRAEKKEKEAKIPKKKLQPFIKEEVLAGIYNETFPCTAEQFFNLLLSDGSSFTNEYRLVRKDTNLIIEPWHAAADEEYDGQVRELNFRSILQKLPMCPPDTAMTEFQHAVLSPDKKVLVFEKVIRTHDVPFGSYFEVHCRWNVETISEASSTLDVKVGVSFKKWCLMQSKIKGNNAVSYKKELEFMLGMAIEYINNTKISGTGDQTANG